MLRKVIYLSSLIVILLLTGISCQENKSSPNTPNLNSDQQLSELYEKAEQFGSSYPDSLHAVAAQILKLGNETNDKLAVVRGEKFTAKADWNLGEHSKSMTLAMKALADAEKWHINTEIPGIYAIIGNLHKEKANYSMAMTSVDKGMKAARLVKDTTAIIYMTRLQAMFTQAMGADDRDTALIHKSLNMHLQGLKLAEISPAFEQTRIAYYNNIAQVYVKRKQLDSAEYFVNKAIVLAKKYNQLFSLTYSYTWLARVHDARGEKNIGLDYLYQATKIAKELKHPFREMELYRYLMEALRGNGKYKEALEAYTQYSELRDSLQVLQNVRQVGELQVRYEAEKKDRQIGALEQINTVRSKQTLMALAGLALFVILSLTMIYQYGIIRRNNQVLAENNSRIREQSERMQFLMKEIHHRVKNNLQIVSNLLSLQANRLSDDEARKIMKAGQQRIETMSIIHRSLYSQDSVNMVNMREYIKDLLDSIIQSFGEVEDQTDLHINVQIEEMDVDIAMPLGLIINEWITNSFKHAFHDVQKPSISLNLVEIKNQIQLEIKDNGPGFDQQKWDRPNGSFGVRLMKVLAKQLDGKCRVLQGAGACFQMEIPGGGIQSNRYN